MISKFHRVHISIEIFTKEYIFLTSYMHWKFQFIHSKIVDQKKNKVLRIQKNNSSLNQ